MMKTVSRSQTFAFRMKRQRLLSRKVGDLADVCGSICGVQAQILNAAKMALRVRLPHLAQPEIDQALRQDRKLVKTLCMRQTLHLISSSDFPLFIAALKKSRIEGVLRVMSRLGIDADEVTRLNALILAALAPGPMTKTDLIRAITPQVGDNMKQWMAQAWNGLRPAIVAGLICYGDGGGKQATFVRTDQWLDLQEDWDEFEAKKVLLRRFVKAYGPVTPGDFSKWAGMGKAEADEVWRGVQQELIGVQFDKFTGFILGEDESELASSALNQDVIRLLPRFDVYLLAHSNKAQYLDPSHYKLVFRSQGWISPVILYNGEIVGIWSHLLKGQAMMVEIRPFKKLAKRVRLSINEEAEALATFWAAKLHLTYPP